MGKTLFDKIWDHHVVQRTEGGTEVLYIDKHLIHEVTSPQAFQGLRQRGIQVRRPDRTIATADHNVPTMDQDKPIQDTLSRLQVSTLIKNCQDFGIELYGLGHPFQGIVHVIGPELGITQPGMTLVCGDSHTSTHGALGAVAFGIGTSEVEQVLATQCVIQAKPKTMRIWMEGDMKPGVTAKDLILYIISQVGIGGATGHFVEYAGPVVEVLSMEGRMTICNMSIEMGARGGLVAPDETTFAYLKGKRFAPQGEDFEKALAWWKSLPSDQDATYDKELRIDVNQIEPMVSYGTDPGMSIGVSELIPEKDPTGASDARLQKALSYMGLESGSPIRGQKIDYVFIGSCTNSRIEDLREVAQFVKGKQKAGEIEAIIVPGSRQVREQAQREGIDVVLRDAGFHLREPGCSACLAMNDDKVPSGAYCISTSNRNFEGRQGPGARTFLASPLMAAAAAISGKIVDVREYL